MGKICRAFKKRLVEDGNFKYPYQLAIFGVVLFYLTMEFSVGKYSFLFGFFTSLSSVFLSIIFLKCRIYKIKPFNHYSCPKEKE